MNISEKILFDIDKEVDHFIESNLKKVPITEINRAVIRAAVLYGALLVSKIQIKENMQQKIKEKISLGRLS